MKKLFIKILSVLMVTALLFTAAACGGEPPPKNGEISYPDISADPGSSSEDGTVVDSWTYISDEDKDVIMAFHSLMTNLKQRQCMLGF